MKTPPVTEASKKSLDPKDRDVRDTGLASGNQNEAEIAKNSPFDGDSGTWTEREGDSFFAVRGCEQMPPFLVNVVSDDDLWMFALSNGAITAGRRNPDHALFPYYTQDKLQDLAGSTGSLTALHATRSDANKSMLWEPWTASPQPHAPMTRSMLKNRTGSTVIFTESHLALGLTWSHLWSLSSRHGVLRKAEIHNDGSSQVSVRLLDGLQNLVPAGVDEAFQNRFSNLLDAYKKGELIEPAGIGVYYLSSIPTDRAEPSEGLRSAVAWSTGFDARTRLLSTTQLDRFKRGEAIKTERDIRGRRGAFLLESEFTLEPGESRSWWIGADTGLDATGVAAIDHWLRNTPVPGTELEEAVQATTSGLLRRVAQVDGLQSTGDARRSWRHFSNAQFNIMRGGVFANGYGIPKDDFLAKLRHFNKAAFERHRDLFLAMPDSIANHDLERTARETKDPDLIRIAGEYLPLTFSRRHGDPSRPWNRFSIDVRDPAGNPQLAYQGNWRDIFQNWEALVHAFPEFTESKVFRFLNATTADGHNPYRITQDGFDWETLDPNEPWSNIGYWGDHQIIYLLKLLEHSVRVHPEKMHALLGAEIFGYAHVPYRIRSHEEIIANPRSTVTYDDEAAELIRARVGKIGADGQLLHRNDGTTVRANLAEKLLIPLLAKLANFVPEGGIWMNTQRPEWNDANNALVGYGISVVTLGYVHRYLDFLIRFIDDAGPEAEVSLATEIQEWIGEQKMAFEAAEGLLEQKVTPAERRSVLDALGTSAASFRGQVYQHALSSDKTCIGSDKLLTFLKTVRRVVAHSLSANQRDDGLWHAYNLLSFDRAGGVEIDRLDEMLEGQVSVLSSQLLSPTEAASLVDALRKSRLYRADQDSYLLYPDRELPCFVAKNRIQDDHTTRSHLLVAMLDAGDRGIVSRDVNGAVRFNGDFRNPADLQGALERIDNPAWTELAAQEASLVADIFEATFNHRAFTGRSGTFFAYEGLGSIYWHMVSKLVMAIQENHQRAIETGADATVVEKLANHYHDKQAGLGIHKSPADYGAFPTDAYSHTPAHAGAQQPGMTGQVKEDLLIRLGELGVFFEAGTVRFAPRLLSRREFLEKPGELETLDAAGNREVISVPANSLAFTLCQTPVIYTLEDGPRIEIHRQDGTVLRRDATTLSADEGRSVFQRMGEIRRIVVRPDPSHLRP